MTAIDPNWERWIWASIVKFVKEEVALLTPTYHVFVEGTERETNQHPAYVELRIDGPKYRPYQGYYRVEVELNIEISVQLNRKLYDQNMIAGNIATIINNYIPVYKLGGLAGDDPTAQIGCLAVDDRAGIDGHKYGQIGTKTRLLQGTMEVRYWINLPA